MSLFTRTSTGAYLAHNATVTADVRLGVDSSVWFTSVIRGDVAPVTIGERVNVQDGSVVHCDSGVPNVIEADVTIGHRAVVHGMRVGRGTLIGMGAVVPPGLEVPDRMLVMGVPGKIARPVSEKELEYMRWLSGHYVRLAERYVAGEFAAVL